MNTPTSCAMEFSLKSAQAKAIHLKLFLDYDMEKILADTEGRKRLKAIFDKLQDSEDRDTLNGFYKLS